MGYKRISRQQHLLCNVQRSIFTVLLSSGHILFSLPLAPFVSIYSVFTLQLTTGKMSIFSDKSSTKSNTEHVVFTSTSKLIV